MHASPARAGSLEAEDGGQLTAQRVDALVQAQSRGAFGLPAKPTTQPAGGWVGSRLLSANTDDWEPALATDPKAPWVYLLTTRYGVVPPGCTAHCPTPFIALAVSTDGGSSFGAPAPLCLCLGVKAQYDPVIEVVPDTGAVYAAMLNGDRHNGFSTAFTKSTDHGRTWSAPVHVYGSVSWTDKPEIAASASGKDVYVSWNGPEGGDLYVGQSHDYGATWTQQKLSNSSATTTPTTDVCSPTARSSSPKQPRVRGRQERQGEVWHHAVISRDGGTTWEDRVVAKVPVGENCVADGCKPDFYIGQTSVASDAPGHLVFAYEGPTTDLGPQRVYVDDFLGRGPHVERGLAALGRRRGRDRPAARGARRDGSALVHADRRRRRSGRVERLVPQLRRTAARTLVGASQDLRRARRSGRLRRAERLRRGLWGLRRDRRHERGQDIRHVGRRLQLHGPRRDTWFNVQR